MSETPKKQHQIEMLQGIGYSYIYPQRAKEWQKCVRVNMDDFWCTMGLLESIKIMETLNKGKKPQTVANWVKNQKYTGTVLCKVLAVVTHFSKHGPEFYRAVIKTPTEAGTKELTKLEEQNKLFHEELVEGAFLKR